MSILHRTRTADEVEPTAVSDYAGEAGDAVACAVCPHPREFHDRIATRFCAATIAQGFSRGCVCTAYPEKEKADVK